MYLDESDKWDKILQMLRRENVAGASVLRGSAGFSGRDQIHRASIVERGGDLPVILIFVDMEEHVSRVLPKLSELAPHKLIVRENVVIEQGNLE
jgi:PII-like signaling protein